MINRINKFKTRASNYATLKSSVEEYNQLINNSCEHIKREIKDIFVSYFKSLDFQVETLLQHGAYSAVSFKGKKIIIRSIKERTEKDTLLEFEIFDETTTDFIKVRNQEYSLLKNKDVSDSLSDESVLEFIEKFKKAIDSYDESSWKYVKTNGELTSNSFRELLEAIFE